MNLIIGQLLQYKYSNRNCNNRDNNLLIYYLTEINTFCETILHARDNDYVHYMRSLIIGSIFSPMFSQKIFLHFIFLILCEFQYAPCFSYYFNVMVESNIFCANFIHLYGSNDCTVSGNRLAGLMRRNNKRNPPGPTPNAILVFVSEK